MRRALFLFVLFGLPAMLVWRWRPLVTFSGTPPTFDVLPEDSNKVRVMADSLFIKLGAPVDTVQWLKGNLLRIRLQRGAFVRRTQYVENGPCVTSFLPVPAVTNVAVVAYRVYGKQRRANQLKIEVPGDSASGGGWFHRGWCRGGGGSVNFSHTQLDSLTGI